MRLVRQKHAWGCAIACAAMILGVEYDDVVQTLSPSSVAELEAGKSCGFYIDLFLEDRSYALCHRWEKRSAPPWPPTPFADLHIASVLYCEGAPGAHQVVVLRDGTVLDPLHDEPRPSLAVYPKVHNLTAVLLVAPS